MLNQNNPSMDALCTAAFVENYFDWIDNLPDDVQRQLTRMRELDVGYRSVMQDLQNFGEQLENDDFESPATRKTLFKMEQILIALQEAGDDKVEISQHITDFIDNKGRQIEQDRKNLESDSGEPTKETVKESNQSERSSAVVSNNGNASEKNSNSANERASKRARRSRADENSEQVETRTTTAKAGNPNPVSSAGKAAAAAKKKKRKCRQREETPPKEEEVVPEIDEPTYCLCDQISYGEMIMCDNDLCPIEWFHFVCVSLNTKPKGKWFCPRCRGDRPNVMKPKSQFLKELEKYNKEKEEKA